MVLWVLIIGLVVILIASVSFQRRQLDKIQWQLKTCIDDSTQSERKAEYTSQLQKLLFDEISDGFIVLDESQIVIQANAVATQIANHQMVGETLIASIPNQALDELVQETWDANGDKMERVIEAGEQSFRTTARKITTERGVLLVITLTDITALNHARRARQEMVRNISHELRTPITSISLIAENLREDKVRRSKKGRKMVNSIRHQVGMMTQLVQEMRDLSRIESGQMPVKLVPAPLEAPIDTGIELLQDLSDNKQQTIEIDIPPNIIVLMDASKIERVVKNIVHNAVKFTREAGTIAITARVYDEDAIVAIADNGQGIPGDDLPRIFERFFQVDRSRHDGTGLGLAIARHIVQAHGGEIWAESVEGKGSTFYFSLSLVN